MELLEMVNKVYLDNLKVNPIFLGGNAKNLIDASAKEYGQLVYDYVNAIFDFALQAEDAKKLSFQQDFALYNKIKDNQEYRDLLVQMVAAHVIVYNFGSYKHLASPEVKFDVYMRNVKSFANGYQVKLLAEYFDGNLELEAVNTLSR